LSLGNILLTDTADAVSRKLIKRNDNMNEMIMSPTEECIPTMLDLFGGCSCPLKKKDENDSFSCDFSAADRFPLAMAYVPMQKFKNLYDTEKALCRGTLFEDLDLPFKGERGGGLK